MLILLNVGLWDYRAVGQSWGLSWGVGQQGPSWGLVTCMGPSFYKFTG